MKVRLIGLLLASSQNSMGNAVQLFGQEKIDGPLDLDTIVTLSVTDILASHAKLVCAIKELQNISMLSLKSPVHLATRPPAPGINRWRERAAKI